MTTNTNPGQPIMSEKELMYDLLNQEKEIAKLYATAITESSCPNMRQVLNQNMQQTCADQYSLFDQMRNKGYYQSKDAQASEVQQAKQKYSTMRNQIS
ncbi:MAG: spore coat protein [Christensenellales bacterium]|jgi:spore coat protein F